MSSLHLKVEQLIQDRAKEIWSDEGEPRDRSMDHWVRAEEEVMERLQTGKIPLYVPENEEELAEKR